MTRVVLGTDWKLPSTLNLSSGANHWHSSATGSASDLPRTAAAAAVVVVAATVAVLDTEDDNGDDGAWHCF
jgi:hypothetical protein